MSDHAILITRHHCSLRSMIAAHPLTDHNSLMSTPQISSTCHFQAELKGLRLPVTFTIPIMPDSLPSASEEPLGPSHSMIFPDKDSHLIDSGTTIRQPQDVVTDTSDTNTEPLETNSRIEDLDLRSHLSVSTSLHCTFTI